MRGHHRCPTTGVRNDVQERLDLSGVEINAHGGVAFLDGLETNELFGGGTALIHVGSGVSLGGTVDWVGTTVDLDEEDGESATLWYYSAELQYGFPSVTQAQFYGLIGAGVAKFQPSEELEDLGVERRSRPGTGSSTSTRTRRRSATTGHWPSGCRSCSAADTAPGTGSPRGGYSSEAAEPVRRWG